MQILKVFEYQKIMKSKVQMSFTLTSLKNILGKQCTEKHFNKKIAMAEKDDGDFENSTKC